MAAFQSAGPITLTMRLLANLADHAKLAQRPGTDKRGVLYCFIQIDLASHWPRQCRSNSFDLVIHIDRFEKTTLQVVPPSVT